MRLREGIIKPLFFGGLASVGAGIVGMLLIITRMAAVSPIVIFALCVGGSLVAMVGDPQNDYV